MIRFTPEQEEFRRAVARFVDAEVAPAAEALDERAEFPRALFERLGELGYLALRYPEAYGGADADMVTYCLLAEELARGSLSVAAAAAMQSLMGTYFVYKYGSEALRARYLTPALRGELVATFALTEPNAGSDVSGITTRAERRGEGWVLRGTKTWVTNAPVADLLTVAAKTSGERGLRDIRLWEHEDGLVVQGRATAGAERYQTHLLTDDDLHALLRPRGNRKDPHFKRLVIHSLQQSRSSPHLLVALVDLASARFLDHLAGHLLAGDPHGKVRHRRPPRHGEGVEGLHLAVFHVLEDLCDLGDSHAVVDGHAGRVLLDLQGTPQPAVGDQRKAAAGVVQLVVPPLVAVEVPAGGRHEAKQRQPVALRGFRDIGPRVVRLGPEGVEGCAHLDLGAGGIGEREVQRQS